MQTCLRRWRVGQHIDHHSDVVGLPIAHFQFCYRKVKSVGVVRIQNRFGRSGLLDGREMVQRAIDYLAILI